MVSKCLFNYCQKLLSRRHEVKHFRLSSKKIVLSKPKVLNMSHEPKLTVYTIKLKPLDNSLQNSNRQLFRQKTGQADNEVQDSVLFMDFFKLFLKEFESPEMYKHEASNKSMTFYQRDIDQNDVDTNVHANTSKFTISGVVEGGPYGRKKNKTDSGNKADKTPVKETDAITDDFYFCIYLPPESNKSILIIQSLIGDSIDSVIKDFWQKFLQHEGFFDTTAPTRYVPQAIIDDFKREIAVSSLTYTTTVAGQTLLDPAIDLQDKNFKITVKIEPLGDMSVAEFEAAKESINDKQVGTTRLGGFRLKRASLKDTTSGKKSPFQLDSDYDVHPVIFLKKYIEFPNDILDFGLVAQYSENLLEKILKPALYPQHAVIEH